MGNHAVHETHYVGGIKDVIIALKSHMPFTLIGAATGIGFMLLFLQFSNSHAELLFKIFHPGHVILSAFVTASLYSIICKSRNFLALLLIGWFGSIGIATLSDSIIPYFGEELFGVMIPTHMGVFHTHDEHAGEEIHDQAAENHDAHGHEARGLSHEHEELHVHEHPEHFDGHTEHEIQHTEHDHEKHAGHTHEHEHVHEHQHPDGPHLHLGFIEHWYIVNPAALLGIFLAWLVPMTRLPHALHVLISTWASASHILMNTNPQINLITITGFFIVLFLAVWLPCCISDIIFPSLFGATRPKKEEHEMKQSDNEYQTDTAS